MNLQEAAVALRLRNTLWPNTPVVDVQAETQLWAVELAPYSLSVVEHVLRFHAGGFALTVGEVREKAKARMPRRPTATFVDARERECPTCGRSPFGPHRGQDACRTCGRDDAPEYARMQSKELV